MFHLFTNISNAASTVIGFANTHRYKTMIAMLATYFVISEAAELIINCNGHGFRQAHCNEFPGATFTNNNLSADFINFICEHVNDFTLNNNEICEAFRSSINTHLYFRN